MLDALKDEEIIRRLKRAELSEALLGKDSSTANEGVDAEKIFTILIERHHIPFTRLLAIRYGIDAASADEITQDFWLECYTALAKYNPDRPFLAWATTILFRTTEKFLKKRKKEIQLSPQSEFFDLQVSPSESVETSVLEKEQIEGMLKALRTLPPELQLLIELRFFQNKKVEDICLETGLGRSTVFEKLNLAYKKMRDFMEKI